MDRFQSSASAITVGPVPIKRYFSLPMPAEVDGEFYKSVKRAVQLQKSQAHAQLMGANEMENSKISEINALRKKSLEPVEEELKNAEERLQRAKVDAEKSCIDVNESKKKLQVLLDKRDDNRRNMELTFKKEQEEKEAKIADKMERRKIMETREKELKVKKGLLEATMQKQEKELRKLLLEQQPKNIEKESKKSKPTTTNATEKSSAVVDKQNKGKLGLSSDTTTNSTTVPITPLINHAEHKNNNSSNNVKNTDGGSENDEARTEESTIVENKNDLSFQKRCNWKRKRIMSTGSSTEEGEASEDEQQGKNKGPKTIRLVQARHGSKLEGGNDDSASQKMTTIVAADDEEDVKLSEKKNHPMKKKKSEILKQELEKIQSGVDELNQTRSQMIWLLKQVITVERLQKEKVKKKLKDTEGSSA